MIDLGDFFSFNWLILRKIDIENSFESNHVANP